MEDIIKILTTQNAQFSGKRRTALSPIVWALGVIVPALLVSAYIGSTILQYLFAGVLGLLVITLVVGFFYCLIKKPDYLRSERFHIENRRLDIAAKKGGKRLNNGENTDISSYVAVLDNANDYVPQIKSKQK